MAKLDSNRRKLATPRTHKMRNLMVASPERNRSARATKTSAQMQAGENGRIFTKLGKGVKTFLKTFQYRTHVSNLPALNLLWLTSWSAHFPYAGNLVGHNPLPVFRRAAILASARTSQMTCAL